MTLPVSGGQLAAIPEVAEAARRAETLYGVSLLNDDVARNVVIRHLRLRNRLDSFDELALLLIIMGIAVSSITGNWAAVILGVPAGIALWIWDANRGSAKTNASVHFTAYIGLLSQARRAGMPFQIPAEWGADTDRASWEQDAAAAPQPPTAPAPYPTAPTARPSAAPAPSGSWWPTDAVIDPKFPVLPAAALTRHWTLAGRAREIGAPYALDFLNEQAVRGLLTTLRRCRHWHLAWRSVSILALLTAVTVFSIGQDPSHIERAQQFRSAAIGLMAVGVCTALPALKTYRTWHRSGMHDHANAYLDLLIEARAYGVPVPVPPTWLDVRNRIRKPS
ncbi:hypothetical protein [Streptomyces sp. LS1784]|uniref:hypothetical protein n=1 Tax=Streptomyces sp. LS1784 TaxID=2851533 RepID=UPI001CCAC92E|nr:hypothetical protein [Streptomyces sp. LS1784]